MFFFFFIRAATLYGNIYFLEEQLVEKFLICLLCYEVRGVGRY